MKKKKKEEERGRERKRGRKRKMEGRIEPQNHNHNHNHKTHDRQPSIKKGSQLVAEDQEDQGDNDDELGVLRGLGLHRLPGGGGRRDGGGAGGGPVRVPLAQLALSLELRVLLGEQLVLLPRLAEEELQLFRVPLLPLLLLLLGRVVEFGGVLGRVVRGLNGPANRGGSRGRRGSVVGGRMSTLKKKKNCFSGGKSGEVRQQTSFGAGR